MGKKNSQEIKAENGHLYFGKRYESFMPAPSPIRLEDLSLQKVYGAIRHHKRSLEDNHKETAIENYDPSSRTVSRGGCIQDQTIAYVERKIKYIAPEVIKLQEEKKLRETPLQEEEFSKKLDVSPDVLAEELAWIEAEAERLQVEKENFDFTQIYDPREMGMIYMDIEKDGLISPERVENPGLDQSRHL